MEMHEQQHGAARTRLGIEALVLVQSALLAQVGRNFLQIELADFVSDAVVHLCERHTRFKA